ncbi:hypothetical protein [Paraburkholderia sp. HD33-4]|uniref:hypothetical protein n=1 Tax=Paraburkholderia sp. HD33-4 TaxID=2883242 RepID=UPI001F3829B4|nr:hypothetical protein [Paraburkholderia sp. HD33-4]
MLTQSTASDLPKIWTAFTNAQVQACVDWLALTQETGARCALARNPLEFMSTASLMLPECVSSAMRYGKSVADLVEAYRHLASGAGVSQATALPISESASPIGPVGVAQVAAHHPARSQTPPAPSDAPIGRTETSASPAVRMNGGE